MSMEIKDPSAVTSSPSQDSVPASTASSSTPNAFSQSESTPAAGDTTPSEGADQSADPSAPAAYTPNYKFRANDQEQEIPAALRAAIKDADTEKQVREIMEKAMGLEPVKGRLQETRTKLQETESRVKAYESSVGELKELYKHGDFDTFFQRLNIPETKILQWLVDKINYQELPPEQRNVLDARKQAEQQARQLEKQNAQLQSQYSEQVASATGLQLQMILGKPEVKSFADSFDSRAGKPGAFYDKVCEIGETAYALRKDAQGRPVILTPDQAVKEAMDFYGKFLPTGQQAPAPTPGATAEQVPVSGQQAPHKSKEPPVIPNVSGKTTSPTKNRPKSIADLEKLYKNMQ
jgi:hypothetical protein